ncbi:MAG: MFS transporter, partial [Janthinobacterium lividum]
LGGIMADRHGIFAVIFGFLILVVLFLLFPLAEQRVGTCVAAIMVWGALHFAVGAPLQTRVVDQAEGAQNLASTLNQGAFNLGNALGATLGAGVLTAGFGYRDLAYASAAVAAIAAGAAAQSWRLEQRQRAT